MYTFFADALCDKWLLRESHERVLVLVSMNGHQKKKKRK
jgi:hypothetical protein